MIHDRNISLRPRTLFIPAWHFTDKTITSSTLVSQESSTSVMSLITGTKLVAGAVSVVNDGFDTYGLIPSDLDRTQKIGVRVRWTKTATGGTHLTSATWTVKFGHIGSSGAIATAATALDTTIAAQTVTNTDTLKAYRTAYGKINASTFATTDEEWVFQVLLTAATNGFNDTVWFRGLELAYAPRLTKGSGRGEPFAVLTNYLDDADAPAYTIL